MRALVMYRVAALFGGTVVFNKTSLKGQCCRHLKPLSEQMIMIIICVIKKLLLYFAQNVAIAAME